MGWELVGFFGVEGLDTRICWVLGVVERKKRPGAKPRDSSLFRGLKPPAPSGRTKTGVFPQL